MASSQELLTENFYRWEKRGRGWRVWHDAVELEPPFELFFHGYAQAQPAIDDARKPTFFSSLAAKITGRGAASSSNPDGSASYLYDTDQEEPEPEIFQDGSPLVEIQISLPPHLAVNKATAE